METPDPPCRPGRSSSSQPRQRQGGNGLPEIGLSPEPISRRPSCRCGFVDQLAQRIAGFPAEAVTAAKAAINALTLAGPADVRSEPASSSTSSGPTQPSNAPRACLSADSRPAGKLNSSWAQRSANSPPRSRPMQPPPESRPGHRRLLFRDCGAQPAINTAPDPAVETYKPVVS
jgi:hypothetical protein